MVAFVASLARRGAAWPRLLAVATVVGAAALPWRLWYRSHGIGGEAPTDVGAGGSLGRVGDALRLSFDVFFDTNRWSVVPIVALIAWRPRSSGATGGVAGFLGAVLGVVFLGGAWVTFGYRDIPITADEALNPIVRYTGAIVLLAAASVPLLLASVWRAAPRSTDEAGCARLAAATSCRPLVAYPAVVLLDGARASRPAEDCVRSRPRATERARPRLRPAGHAGEAEELLAKVRGVGYVDAEVQGDGCAPVEGPVRRDRVLRAGRELASPRHVAPASTPELEDRAAG